MQLSPVLRMRRSVRMQCRLWSRTRAIEGIALSFGCIGASGCVSGRLASWNSNHAAALTARSTSRSQMGSTPGSARTIAPPISMVIAPQPFAVGAGAASWRASVTTGMNAGVSSIGRLSWPARAALRQSEGE